MKTRLLKKLRRESESRFRIEINSNACVESDVVYYIIEVETFHEEMLNTFSNCETAVRFINEYRRKYIVNKTQKLRFAKWKHRI